MGAVWDAHSAPASETEFADGSLCSANVRSVLVELVSGLQSNLIVLKVVFPVLSKQRAESVLQFSQFITFTPGQV